MSEVLSLPAGELVDLRCHLVSVRRTAPLTPRMVRVTLGGELPGFEHVLPDQDVRLLLPREGERDPTIPVWADGVGPTFPEGPPPAHARAFTIRRFDREAGEVDIDFALHSGGVASDWAREAEPGDRVGLVDWDRGDRWRPPEGVGRFLLVGDACALPAIACHLEWLPAGARARAIVEVEDEEEELILQSPAALELTWLHRDGLRLGESRLAEAVRAEDLDGAWVWAAGEARAMRAIRRHLRDEAGLARGMYRATGYWHYRPTPQEHWVEVVQPEIARARAEGRSEREIERLIDDLEDAAV